mmetsp:Transcript_47246/g.109313  ORF Transcript_47246/g.109313 Transcript_47246/m.109313 type:complete len:432 (-) Transcript_47246:131-1426(-)
MQVFIALCRLLPARRSSASTIISVLVALGFAANAGTRGFFAPGPTGGVRKQWVKSATLAGRPRPQQPWQQQWPPTEAQHALAGARASTGCAPGRTAKRRARWARLPAAFGAAALALFWLPSAAVAMASLTLEAPLPGAIVAKFFLAGGAGCCISHAAATPFDVVKTRQQSDPGRYVHTRTGRKLGVVDTGIQIAREEGPQMLLQGMRTTLVGYLFQGAVKYSLWEVFKAELGFAQSAGVMKVLILVVAALTAEIFASLVLCPFERMRIRLVADPSFAKGMTSAVRRMLREEGIIGALYGEGLAATLFKQIAYTVAKLTVFVLAFEELTHQLPWEVPRAIATLLSSIIAGVVASLSSQPGDTLQICTSSDSSLRDECPVDTATGAPPSMMKLARTLGWQALFTGWRARLIHVEVIVVSQLLIYDAILHSMGL